MPDRFQSKHILVCVDCGRTRPTTPEQQLVYMSNGWPKCCDEVMVLYIEAEKPKHKGKTQPPAE
jgi:hypothetical protein